MNEAQETLHHELGKFRSLLVNLPDPHQIKDEEACYYLANLLVILRTGFELALDQGGGQDDPDDMTGLGAAFEGEWEAQVLSNRKGHAQAPPTNSLHRRGSR